MITKIVHWELPVIWDKDGDEGEKLREMGVEPEQHTQPMTICVNDILAYHTMDHRNTTHLRFHGHSWEVSIPYKEFKKQCAEKVKECNGIS